MNDSLEPQTEKHLTIILAHERGQAGLSLTILPGPEIVLWMILRKRAE